MTAELFFIEDLVNQSNPDLAQLRVELGRMASAIARTQREISGIKPRTDRRHHVGAAVEELALAVSSTEEAATNILGIAERLQAIETELKGSGIDSPLCTEIGVHAVNLMLACSFQDVTGQRMTKAARTLEYIEERINGLIAIWGEGAAESADIPLAESCDAQLMNGPGKSGEGISQDDIDALLG